MSLIDIDLSNFDTSSVTDMGCMFENCKNLNSINLSGFNTSNVTNMLYMFTHCSSLQHISADFDLSKVHFADVIGMFIGCDNLII
jgi:surface protein